MSQIAFQLDRIIKSTTDENQNNPDKNRSTAENPICSLYSIQKNMDLQFNVKTNDNYHSVSI